MFPSWPPTAGSERSWNDQVGRADLHLHTNASPANASHRKAVTAANAHWGLAEIGSSDAHFWQHVGAGYTLFPGDAEDDLRAAITARTTRSAGQDEPTPRLNPGAYVAQCAWSWFVDPPRRMMGRRRESTQTATSDGQNRRNMTH
jgi:hypothetical protein